MPLVLSERHLTPTLLCSLLFARLVAHLEFAQVYIDDLLVLTNGSFEDHFSNLGKVLALLQEAGLKCNADKCKFCADEVEYLGYLLIRMGIKPLP